MICTEETKTTKPGAWHSLESPIIPQTHQIAMTILPFDAFTATPRASPTILNLAFRGARPAECAKPIGTMEPRSLPHWLLSQIAHAMLETIILVENNLLQQLCPANIVRLFSLECPTLLLLHAEAYTISR